MKKLRKIPGFTLLEAMVAVMLTSFLVLLTFQIYMNFNQTYFALENTTNNLNELLLFKGAIDRDWYDTYHPTKQEETLVLDKNKQEVRYTFEEEWIIREAVRKDTFKILVKELEFVELGEGSGVLEKVKLTLEKNKQEYFITLDKNHDIKTKMALSEQ